MTLLAVGINYNTAPVSIRERLSFPAEILESSLKELWRLKEISEAAILSTCNRTEFYCTSTTANQQILIDWVAQSKQINACGFRTLPVLPYGQVSVPPYISSRLRTGLHDSG